MVSAHRSRNFLAINTRKLRLFDFKIYSSKTILNIWLSLTAFEITLPSWVSYKKERWKNWRSKMSRFRELVRVTSKMLKWRFYIASRCPNTTSKCIRILFKLWFCPSLGGISRLSHPPKRCSSFRSSLIWLFCKPSKSQIRVCRAWPCHLNRSLTRSYRDISCKPGVRTSQVSVSRNAPLCPRRLIAIFLTVLPSSSSSRS